MAIIDLGSGQTTGPVKKTKRIIDLETGDVNEVVSDLPELKALPEEPQQRYDNTTEYGRISSAIQDSPVLNPIGEFSAGVGRGAVDMANMLVINPINAALEIAGSDLRITDPKELEIIQKMTSGNTMEPGLMRDIVGKAGEFTGPGVATGAALRGATKGIQAIPEASRTIGQRISAQLGKTTPTQDATGSIVAGAGYSLGGDLGKDNIGEQEGQLIGSIFAPVLSSSAVPAIKSAFNAGKKGVLNLIESVSTLSDDGASTLLAEAMVREGLTPDDVIARLAQLGPEAIPADVGNNFARLLRTASNRIPRIEGHAAEVFKARQSGQGSRLLNAFDDAGGTSSLNVDDEIIRLNKIMGPEIKRLYQEVGSENIILSPKLRSLLNDKTVKGGPPLNSLAKAQRKAQARLADKRAAGDQITNIDLIDATKQEVDDQIGKAIRQGQMNKARDLIRLKNIMVSEADNSIPVYKEARDLFAGKVALENAAEQGEMFLKLKPRDVMDLTKSFSQSEMKMFKLGAKQAILDKVDDIQVNADAVKRIFGKNGDLKKLRHLFENEKSFNRFKTTLQVESNFIMTRNAAQANSTTAKQLADEDTAFQTLGNTAASLTTPAGQMSLLNKIMTGLSKKKTDQVFIESLEKAGDILLIKGVELPRILRLLTSANKTQLKKALDSVMAKPNKLELTPATASAGSITATENLQE